MCDPLRRSGTSEGDAQDGAQHGAQHPVGSSGRHHHHHAAGHGHGQWPAVHGPAVHGQWPAEATGTGPLPAESGHHHHMAGHGHGQWPPAAATGAGPLPAEAMAVGQGTAAHAPQPAVSFNGDHSAPQHVEPATSNAGLGPHGMVGCMVAAW
jgi:hypothetical protein